MLPLDSRLIVFPPMALPPWVKPPAGWSWEGFLLDLTLQAEGAGAHVLNADFVGLLPCDGFVRFLPLNLGLATSIRYDGSRGQITRATTAMVGHVPDGPGLMLYPGVYQRIVFAAQAAPLADILTTGTLKIEYRQRRRVL